MASAPDSAIKSIPLAATCMTDAACQRGLTLTCVSGISHRLPRAEHTEGACESWQPLHRLQDAEWLLHFRWTGLRGLAGRSCGSRVSSGVVPEVAGSPDPSSRV